MTMFETFGPIAAMIAMAKSTPGSAISPSMTRMTM